MSIIVCDELSDTAYTYLVKKRIVNYWDKIPPIMKNKFLLTGLAFLTYLMFFDSVDIPSQIKLHRHLNQLNNQTEYLKSTIEEDRSEYEATLSTLEQMETYAREEYKMKRPDEDLFIIQRK